ncbi:cytochrome b [Caldivirga maquilingensis]|uniref:Cytochrome b/b6 domain n=1 Tax=Caldivirga maquilingensis (strain ATCC 700844 / DSM 13496 / JCM 10307 / IC-167) TaxID=397948 RepID=A8MBM3_CALMQ|nr:cytochrome bc complex cytochrome b subunit [Caldivirga maquilingensis]ABW02756.1 Cytochrome b/b6 domain [Caldivirga maquilingensis IC-167]
MGLRDAVNNASNRIRSIINSVRGFSIEKWLEERTRLSELPLVGVPDYMLSLRYWTGGLVASAFFWQVVTGLILLLYYQPSNPYDSTMSLINNTIWGKVLLASHLYGAYVMIFLMLVHMFRNYFEGSYKRPRELQWFIGVIMGAVTFGIAFFGYSLIGDTLSVDGADVAKGLIQGFPGGSTILTILFGTGSEIEQYTRVLAWHIILAALLMLLLLLHLGLAEQHGIMPDPRRHGYRAPALYDKSKVPPWWPRNFLYTVAILFWTWGFIILIPSILLMLPPNSIPILFSPLPGPPPTSPQAASIPPYPLWFFLYVYKIVDFGIPAFSGTQGAAVAVTVGGIIPLLFLLLLPFLDRSDKLHPLDRIGFTIVMVWLLVVWLSLYSVLGALTPGVIIPPSIVALITLPPTVVIIGGLLAVRRIWVNQLKRYNGTVTAGTVTDLKSKAKEIALKRAYATLALIVLTAVEIAIMAVFWRIAPYLTPKDSQVAGALVGVGLIVFGEVIALYRYIAYPPKVTE